MRKTKILIRIEVRSLLRKTIVLCGRIVGVGVLVWHVVLGWHQTLIELSSLEVYLGLDLRS